MPTIVAAWAIFYLGLLPNIPRLALISLTSLLVFSSMGALFSVAVLHIDLGSVHSAHVFVFISVSGHEAAAKEVQLNVKSDQRIKCR